MSSTFNFWQCKIKLFLQFGSQRLSKISHLIKVSAMVMVDPGKYLVNPIIFHMPSGKNLFELELSGSKEILRVGFVAGIVFHANRIRPNNSNDFKWFMRIFPRKNAWLFEIIKI